MTTLFSPADVEAAARLAAVAAGRKAHDWAAFRVQIEIYLNAAVASLEARGAMITKNVLQFPEAAMCFGKVPVAIIRIEEPKT